MLNNLRIAPKLGLLMLVPLLAVIAMVGIVWQDGATEIVDARADREIARAVSVTSILPRHLLSEALVYDLSTSGPVETKESREILLPQLREIVDQSAERFRDLPREAVPFGIRRALEAELVALEEIRARSDAATLRPAEVLEMSSRLSDVNADVLSWMGSQDISDPNGSWRLLVVTAPSNATLLDAAGVAYRTLLKGTLTGDEARFLEDTLASFLTLSRLQDSLLPEDLPEGQRGTVDESRQGVTELIGRALALENRTPPEPLTQLELLRSYQLGLTVLEAGTRREQSLAADVVSEADALILRTQQERLLILTGMLLVMLVAVGAMVVIARDIAIRLGRVSEQAERLNAGVIDGPPTAAVGSDEIAVLGSAMNGVSNLYRRLVAQTEAIAAGRLDDKALSEPLPGALGAALQSGVSRVASTSAELLKLATHDDLTDLLDRSGLARAVEALSASRGNGTAAAFFVDLDGFKDINDTFGHAAGDKVLIEIARRLREVARSDDAIARLGGDEFVVLAPQVTDEAGARLIAERMAEVLNRPLPLTDGVAEISASIGWSLAPPGKSLSEAIEDADSAMYEAKRAVRAGSAGVSEHRGPEHAGESL